MLVCFKWIFENRNENFQAKVFPLFCSLDKVGLENGLEHRSSPWEKFDMAVARQKSQVKRSNLGVRNDAVFEGTIQHTILWNENFSKHRGDGADVISLSKSVGSGEFADAQTSAPSPLCFEKFSFQSIVCCIVCCLRTGCEQLFWTVFQLDTVCKNGCRIGNFQDGLWKPITFGKVWMWPFCRLKNPKAIVSGWNR